MRVQSLRWEDPLEEEVATHSSILAWRIPWTRSLVCYHPWGHKELDTIEHTHTHSHTLTDQTVLSTSCSHACFGKKGKKKTLSTHHSGHGCASLS